MLLQVGQHTVLQHAGNGVAVLIADGRPVGAAAQIGHHREGIKTVATRRGQRRVGGGGAVQVQAEVFGQFVVFKDVLQQTFVTWSQHHHVVRHVGVLALGAKVPNEQARRVVAFCNALVAPVAPVLWLDQVLVGPGRVAVADHDVGGHHLAAGQHHAGGGAVVYLDTGDSGVVADGDVALLQQVDQGLDNGTGAAHGRVHAPAPLQDVDERVHAGDRKRVATDEQGVKAHDDAQLGVLNVLGHQAVDGAPGLHARQVGQGLDDIGDGLKGDHAQLLKAQLKAALGGLH